MFVSCEAEEDSSATILGHDSNIKLRHQRTVCLWSDTSDR